MRRAVAAAPPILVCLIAAPASLAGPIDGSSRSLRVDVPSGSLASTDLDCGNGRFALSGAVARTTGDVTPISSRPGSQRSRWLFELRGGPGGGRARVVARCGRIRLPRGVRRGTVGLATARSDAPLGVPAGGTAASTLRCPAGKQPTGWGFTRESRNVFPYRVAFTRSRLRVGLENSGSARESATSYLRCISRRVRLRGRSDPAIRIRRRSARTTLGGGRESVRRTCRRRELSLTTGFSVDPARVNWVRSYPARTRLGRYAFDGAGRARTTLLCLR